MLNYSKSKLSSIKRYGRGRRRSQIIKIEPQIVEIRNDEKRSVHWLEYIVWITSILALFFSAFQFEIITEFNKKQLILAENHHKRVFTQDSLFFIQSHRLDTQQYAFQAKIDLAVLNQSTEHHNQIIAETRKLHRQTLRNDSISLYVQTRIDSANLEEQMKLNTTTISLDSAALLLAVDGAEREREVSLKSLRPYIQFDASEIASNSRQEITVANFGSGVAIIHDIHLHTDRGDRFSWRDDFDRLEKQFYSLDDIDSKKVDLYQYDLPVNIKDGKRLRFLSNITKFNFWVFKGQSDLDEEYSKFQSKIRFEVFYTSVFEDEDSLKMAFIGDLKNVQSAFVKGMSRQDLSSGEKEVSNSSN